MIEDSRNEAWPSVYHASPEELKLIDEALAAIARGEIASDEEVEAVFAKYRLSSPGLSR
jgi:hypothetical protein